MRKKLVFLSAIVFVLTTLVCILVIVKNKPKTVELCAVCTTDSTKLSFGSYEHIELRSKSEVGYDKNRSYTCEDLDTYNSFLEYFNNDNNIKCDDNTFVYLYNGMYYGVQLRHLINGEGEFFYINTYSFVSLEIGFVPTFYGFGGGYFDNTDDKIGKYMYEIDYSKFCGYNLNPLKINSKEGILKFYKNIDPKYVDILDNVITFKNIKSNRATFKMTLNDDSMIIEEIIDWHYYDDIRIVDNNQNVEIYASSSRKKLSFGEYSDVKLEQFSHSDSEFYTKFYCKTEEKYNEILSIFELDDKNIKCDNNTFVYLYEGMYYGVTFKTYVDDNQIKKYEILTYGFVSYDRKVVATFYGSYSSIFTNAKFYDSVKKKYIVPYDEMFDMINSNTDLNPLKISNKDGILSFYKDISSDYVEILGDTVKFKNSNGDFIEKITFYDTYLEVEKI